MTDSNKLKKNIHQLEKIYDGLRSRDLVSGNLTDNPVDMDDITHIPLDIRANSPFLTSEHLFPNGTRITP